MGFEHERIHLETSSVLIRELPLALVQRPAEWPKLHPTAGRAATSFPPRIGWDCPTNEDVYKRQTLYLRVPPMGESVIGNSKNCLKKQSYKFNNCCVGLGFVLTATEA